MLPIYPAQIDNLLDLAVNASIEAAKLADQPNTLLQEADEEKRSLILETIATKEGLRYRIPAVTQEFHTWENLENLVTELSVK